MYRILFNSYQIIFLLICLEKVHMEEPCTPPKYIEERLLEKMVEIDFKMQKVLERLSDLEEKDQQKTTGMNSLTTKSSQPLMVDSLETDGWQMVFRATASNGQDVYNSWTTGKGTCSEKPLAMERSYSCHYRDSLVSNWDNLGVKNVKFAFYDRFQEVAYVIFNGSGSNINNWFDKSRVISSSWPDLTSVSTYNTFSISGYFDHPRLDRRFYISKLHKGCPGDMGHMVVINSAVPSPACLWDSHASHPQFLYSKIPSVDFWERRMFGRADFLAIFIKT